MSVLLATLTIKEELAELVAKLPYTVDTIRIVRECLPTDELQRGRILDFAAANLVDTWNSDRDTAGKMATLLSQTCQDWNPETETVLKLVALCEEVMEKSDTSMIAVVQPTAYVLGALGHREFHGKWLQTTTMGALWREADLGRNKDYYSADKKKSRGNQLAAIERHLQDKSRVGLLKAHDVGLLFQMCREHEKEGLKSDDPEVKRTKELLAQVIQVLEEEKQDELVAYIQANLRLGETH